MARSAHERYGIKGALGVGAGVALEIAALTNLPAMEGDIKAGAILGVLLWMLGSAMVRGYNSESQNPQIAPQV